MKTMLIAIELLLAGCVSSGTQVKDTALTQFQKGVTTEADVVKALGPPQSTTTLGDGRRLVIYSGMHGQVKGATFIPVVGLFAGGATVHQSTVVFTFGQDGKLVEYSSTQSNADSTSGVAAGYQPPAPSPAVVK